MAKVDYRLGEFDVLHQVLDDYEGQTLPFAQLQLEVHAWFSNEDLGMSKYLHL